MLIAKRRKGYRNISSCHAFVELVEQLGLARQDLGSGGIQVEPGGAIGKAAIRPLSSGHSISKELLTEAVSKSASLQKAITRRSDLAEARFAIAIIPRRPAGEILTQFGIRRGKAAANCHWVMRWNGLG